MKSSVQEQASRGTVFAILAVGMGINNLLDYLLWTPRVLHELLQGVGFLLAAPWFYFEPFSLRKTDQRPADQNTFSTVRIFGLLGTILLVTGLVLDLL